MGQERALAAVSELGPPVPDPEPRVATVAEPDIEPEQMMPEPEPTVRPEMSAKAPRRARKEKP